MSHAHTNAHRLFTFSIFNRNELQKVFIEMLLLLLAGSVTVVCLYILALSLSPFPLVFTRLQVNLIRNLFV